MACSPAIDQAKLTKIHTYIHNPLYLLCVSLLHKISCSLSYRFTGFSSSIYIIISSLGEREEEEKRSIVGQPTSYIPHLLLSFSHSHISFPIFSAKRASLYPLVWCILFCNIPSSQFVSPLVTVQLCRILVDNLLCLVLQLLR